jgi:glutathione synthase/RimK-type ligase-like ATP-grasp enzyme
MAFNVKIRLMNLLLITNDLKVLSYQRLVEECGNLSINVDTLNPEGLNQVLPLQTNYDNLLNRYTSIKGYDQDLELLTAINQQNCINQLKGLQISRSKMAQCTYFERNQLPSIPSLYIQGKVDNDYVRNFLQKYGEKYITKPIRGNGGRGITFFESHKSLLSYLETCQVLKDQKFLIQPFIESKLELRLLMTNYKPFLAIKKSAELTGIHFRRNLSRINEMELIDVSQLESSYQDMIQNSQNLCHDLKLKLCAIDLIVDQNNNYQFLEINSVPGWTYLEEYFQVTKENRNITREILEHIIK